MSYQHRRTLSDISEFRQYLVAAAAAEVMERKDLIALSSKDIPRKAEERF